DRGMAAGKNVSIDGILRQGKFWTNTFLLALLLLGGLALGVACVKTKTMSTWFNRNVMLGNAAWPQDFYFQVANADGMTLSVPRGDDYVLKASVQEGYRYLPEDVKVEFRSGSGRRLESMDRADDGKAFHHQMMSVTEPITFRLRSKKIASEWYQIELLHRPEIAEIELLSKPPDYTGAEVTALPPGAGPYYVLKGSSLGVRGSADKPLVSAAVVSGENRWPLDIKDEKFAGAVPADQLVSGSFVLEIEDTEQVLQDEETTPRGLGSRDPLRFKLRLKEDETPKIKARLEGVSAMVVSRARLPYTATLTEAFEIESLDIPAGSRLSLHLMAIDNDIVSGPKVGESTKMIVRVVSEAELRDDLLRREKDQRQLVAEMVDQQDLLLTESQGLLAQTRDVAVLTSEQRSQSVRFEKRQKLLGGGLMPLVGRLRGMVAEIQNNKLEDADGVLQERLRDRIIDPLQALAENELNLASEYLGRVRRAKKAEERRIVFTAAVNNQQIALKRLRAILVHMVKNESYQQAVNLLYEIQKSQDDLRKRT
ncbi:MAG: hypothetical protein ACKVHP_09745, partial [Verrucomicrobiales bacterium]